MNRVLAVLVLLVAGIARAAEEKALPGLVASYEDSAHHRVVTLAPTANFALKESESIHPQLSPAFNAEWAGLLRIDKRAKYTFKTDGAPDAKLSIDGKPIEREPIELDIGDHALSLAYARNAGASARLQLIWSADYFAFESVPPSALLHKSAPSDAQRSVQIEEGQRLVEELNCVACHHSVSKAISPRPALDLTTSGTRLHAPWIARWLKDPRAFRPTAAMPTMPLSDSDRRDVAAYLGTLKDPNNKVKEQPQPSRAEAGKELFSTIGCASCHKDVPLGAIGSKWLTGQLAEYLVNPLGVDRSGRMPSMLLGKDDALAIAEYLVQTKDAAYEEKLADDADVKRGQHIVQTQGCINCHVIEHPAGKPLATSAPSVPALEQLREGHGCLAEHPSGRAVDYALDAAKRSAIVAFIAAAKEAPFATPAPVYTFYHQTRTLGCLNCHELNDSKPAEEAERIPQLTNVGGRLRPEWLRQVLTQKQRVRPWLKRRMPDFGSAAVGHLPDAAIAVAGVGDSEALPVPSREEIAAGQKLTGTGAGGLGCITCHGYAGGKPNVIDDTRGPDLDTAAARLRPDHFRRWLLDPKRVAPSTPMPNFFDALPHDEAVAKVETIFRYVAQGNAMPPPIGWVDKTNYIVAVHDQPVIIRAVMPNPTGQGSLPRGIAVGLPELINYCFDASTCTLRYAWSGGFLDMQPSWSGRGGNQVRVQGQRFYATSTFPLRLGDSAGQPQPRFEGYVLAEGRPTFVYRLGDVEIRETITAPPRDQKDPGLIRTFELDSAGKPLTILLPDASNLNYATTAGTIEPGDVEKTHVVRLPPGKIKFSITITVKESE
jgi:mono/diheme cytochrome c family protein